MDFSLAHFFSSVASRVITGVIAFVIVTYLFPVIRARRENKKLNG